MSLGSEIYKQKFYENLLIVAFVTIPNGKWTKNRKISCNQSNDIIVTPRKFADML